MTASFRLVLVTSENRGDAVAIHVRPEQEAHVATVLESLEEAAATPTAWPCLVYDGDTAVGFVMGNFDPDHEIEAFRCGVWRLNVAAGAQGRGVGRFAVEAVVAEARRRGQVRVTVLWVRGDEGPEGFYRRMGFVPSGELFGQVVGVKELPATPGRTG